MIASPPLQHLPSAQLPLSHSSCKPGSRPEHGHCTQLTTGHRARYVFCRQRQDDSLRRGADQHSLVLLSEHPYSSVLVPLCQWAGPFYFNHGQIALEEVQPAVQHSTDSSTCTGLPGSPRASQPSVAMGQSALMLLQLVVALHA